MFEYWNVIFIVLYGTIIISRWLYIRVSFFVSWVDLGGWGWWGLGG